MVSGGLRHRRKRRGGAGRERWRDPTASLDPRVGTLHMCKHVHCSATCEATMALKGSTLSRR
eukprot:11802655-Alexandrium_andersonii.AAC.1